MDRKERTEKEDGSNSGGRRIFRSLKKRRVFSRLCRNAPKTLWFSLAVSWAFYYRQAIRRCSLDALVLDARNPRERFIACIMPDVEIEIIARLVGRLPERITGRARCLVRSLVLLRFLSLVGLDARLVLGAPHSLESGNWHGHAWVETSDGRVLGDRDSCHAEDDFVRLISLPIS